MSGSSLNEAIDEMRNYIRRDVAGGFDSCDEIVSMAVEVLSDDYDADLLAPHAERLAKEALEEHLRAQNSWPEVTDCDRLDAAFADLEKLGIVCRQNFSCCCTCGAAEIGDEMAAEREGGREVMGFAFYHMQDTEGAVEGGTLWLSYGSILRGEEAALGIAKEVIEHLERHGLSTVWDGSWQTRITVQLDWRRRR